MAQTIQKIKHCAYSGKETIGYGKPFCDAIQVATYMLQTICLGKDSVEEGKEVTPYYIGRGDVTMEFICQMHIQALI